ncbi:sensor histidine kinase [Paenibacillus radicis (ex Gao et al. 2016)]|uniref:Sensor histidine kinase YesM n=1 Tax=Paenibacillus radicis (ex Gao et al. 2016) TaxID=1737354 RepID=A0A917LS83_9BACL|nr:sensor histidine kinase [Paenibacillus radicis (ex Gao et al. 2016)]GGG53504.1 sensor histidine kinase YesM [Paenibacillus radicis (ex Gao et al. 2016)]
MIKRWLRYPMSMRYRFMFVFFILIAVPFALVGYIALSKSEKTIHNSNLDSVVQTGKNLDNFFYYVRNEQDKIMASDELQTLFNDELNDGIDEIDYANKLISYTDTLNYANKLFKIRLFPLNPAEHPVYMKSAYDVVDMNQVPWFEEIVANGRSFWNVFGAEEHSSLFVQSTLGSVKRLHSLKTFQPLGIVVMEIRPSILAEFIYPVKQLDNQKLMLVNKNNEIIYSTDDKYGEIEDSLKPELLASQVSKTMNYEGKSSLISASAVMGGELRLVSIVPLKDLNNPVAVLNKLTLAFLVFYFLLSIFLAGYLTVKYTSPISSLVRQMKVLARNNFKEDSLSRTNLVERSDEVGWLYRGMHNMIGEINKLLKETKESEKRKKQLEFQVLAYQINPHFLYNTLDTIRWKAEAHHIDEISEIVSSLGSLFRLSLNGGKEITNVRKELELLKAYVNIEKVRQSSLVRITYRIEEEILQLPFMRLVLQPLVENAIRHGIADKGDAGMILIQGGLEENGICFRITDNGPGIPEEMRQTLLDPAAATKNDREGGLGLINVHERLRHYFGEAYGLEIESELNKGTTIVLWHPILPEDTTELDG